MIDFVKVGERISKYRKKAGLSQEELADKLFVTRQALSKWENGLSVPSVDTLIHLSRMFSVSFEEILGLFEEPEYPEDEENIFLGKDRGYIVTSIAKGDFRVNLPSVFYQMSPAERMYVLRHVKDGSLKTDIEELWVKLTLSEQRFLGGSIDEIQKSNN